MPKCTVCNHSRAHDINLALLAGDTLDHLKQQFGLSRSALHRHKRHLQTIIDRAEDRMCHNFRLGYLFQLNDYNAAAAATVADARAEGSHRLTLQAANAGARIIKAMAEFEVDLDRETVYRLITSPDYVLSGCLLPGDPRVLTGPRQSLARSLAAACPETDSDPLIDPEDVAAYLKLAREPDADTPLPHARQLELTGFLVPLAGVLPAAADSASTLSARPPKPKRDASGIEAGQTSPLAEIIEGNQFDVQVGKLSGTDLAAGPTPDPLPSACCLQPIALSPPAPAAASGPSSILCDQQPEPQCDASATKAGQTPSLSENIEEIQIDMQAEQISGTDPAAGPAPDSRPETLPEPLAAQLVEYLANFAPYTNPAQALAPDPLPPDPVSMPAAPRAPAPRRSSLRPEPPNFGNPGLFKQLQGTFI